MGCGSCNKGLGQPATSGWFVVGGLLLAGAILGLSTGFLAGRR